MFIKILYVIITYFFTSVSYAYIFTKAFKGIDIRTVGSGNPGTTNVFRVAGKGVGSLTFLADVAKGFICVYFARFIDPSFIFLAIVGICAICGHMFTIFLNFKGGKGVATALGVFLALMPSATLIAVLVFAIIFLASGIVSLASILASLALVISGIILGFPLEANIFATIVAAIVIYKHKANIKRLISGTENKFDIFGKNKK
ncbi:MAG: glycerol-3-phosphate 1-O-acyltransferase PlsY [Elusimicrobiota bacterium]|jgi:glycerol-3-phosphate acyltransferase PlsY|nr:glycerol-3-phosphate 1-O-acyltransferase PlsY [Elusimicrobiota bacterium]